MHGIGPVQDQHAPCLVQEAPLDQERRAHGLVGTPSSSRSTPQILGAVDFTEICGHVQAEKSLVSRTISDSGPSSRQLASQRKFVTARGRIGLFLSSVEFQVFMMLVTLFDACAFVVQEAHFAMEDGDSVHLEWPDYVDVGALGMYFIEIMVRLVCFHCYFIMSNSLFVFDMAILLVSAPLLIFEGPRGFVTATRPLALRALRGVAKLGRLFVRSLLLVQATRNKVSKNKMRFIDYEHRLNLDLTYIDDDLIAMGVPATSLVDLMFRNPLREVARFFKLNHRNHFRVYNLCPEMPYEDTAFKRLGGSVCRFEIEDHSPPRMDQFVEFLQDARDFRGMHDENVLAVHCKAGKGRTGSFCCAWLLHVRAAQTADEALACFAERRTNTGIGKKLRGVETPSQVRYIRQLHRHLRDTDSWLDSPSRPPHVPAPEVALSELRLEGGFLAHPAEIAGLRVLVQCFPPGPSRAETVLETETVGSRAQSVPLEDVPVRGDVRVALFEAAARDMGFSARDAAAAVDNFNKAKGLLAYFWLHTGFVQPEGQHGCGGAAGGLPKSSSHTFDLDVEQVDIANRRIQRGKRKGRFAEGSRLVLCFSSTGDEALSCSGLGVLADLPPRTPKLEEQPLAAACAGRSPGGVNPVRHGPPPEHPRATPKPVLLSGYDPAAYLGHATSVHSESCMALCSDWCMK